LLKKKKIEKSKIKKMKKNRQKPKPKKTRKNLTKTGKNHGLEPPSRLMGRGPKHSRGSNHAGDGL
jgi:hypothetical protein